MIGSIRCPSAAAGTPSLPIPGCLQGRTQLPSHKLRWKRALPRSGPPTKLPGAPDWGERPQARGDLRWHLLRAWLRSGRHKPPSLRAEQTHDHARVASPGRQARGTPLTPQNPNDARGNCHRRCKGKGSARGRRTGLEKVRAN